MRAFVFLCAATFCQGATPPIYAQDAPAEKAVTDFVIENQPVPDALIALSKATHLNIIADTTSAAEVPPATVSGRWRMTPWNIVGNFGRDAGLASQKLNERSWMLWPQPDIRVLSRRIAAGESVTRIQQINRAPAGVRPAGQPDETLNAPLVSALYNAGWRADDVSTWHAIALSDLPPELRANIGARVQSELLKSWQNDFRNAWLRDEFWESAALRIVTPPRPPAGSASRMPARILEISGQPPGSAGSTTRPLGALDAL